MVVVGRGRLGRSLARALQGAGREVVLVPGREALTLLPEVLAEARPEVAFLAVPDSALPSLAEGLANANAGGRALFAHLSGAATLDVLEPLRRRDADVGAFHPLQSFATEREPDAFRGILVAVDASSEEAAAKLTGIANELQARARRVTDEHRAAYHAAAVLGSNYVVALVAEAVDVLTATGWTREDALLDLLPLVEGVVANVRREGLPGALTGPIRRGDADTVARNLQALDLEVPDAARVYRIVGLAALKLAQEAGLDETKAAEIRTALTRQEQRPGGAP